MTLQYRCNCYQLKQLLKLIAHSEDLLAIAVREDQEIEGIEIEQEETKLLQYGDDTTAILSDVKSVHKLFLLLNIKFHKLFGLNSKEI